MHRLRLSLILTVVCLVAAVPAFAGHAWGTYHWSKSSSAELALPIHDNVDTKWDSYLDQANVDWNKSIIFNNTVQWNSPLSSVKRCTSDTGKIEVCNARYGQTGWLGVAGIWTSGGHIVKGYTKVNDTYFDTAKYNTYYWKAFVMCQEIGHDFGLGHVNEDFNDPNTGSCMDYTNDPSRNDGAGTHDHPNKHDYDMLETIYNHLHSASLPFTAATNDATRPRTIEEIYANAGQWGTPVAFDGNGRPSVFRLEIGTDHDGHHGEILTHVFWAPVDPFENEKGERPGVRQ